MILKVDKISGFYCKDIPKIFDANNNIFYYPTYLKKWRGKFNLPIGVYYTDSNLVKLTTPHQFLKGFNLPRFEREFLDNVDKAKVLFDENPHKCTIFHDKNIILFDNSFKSKPLLDLLTIVGHERGHKKYFTEWKCDLYAYYLMLKKGYNPSQVKISMFKTLNKNTKNLNRLIKWYKQTI